MAPQTCGTSSQKQGPAAPFWAHPSTTPRAPSRGKLGSQRDPSRGCGEAAAGDPSGRGPGQSLCLVHHPPGIEAGELPGRPRRRSHRGPRQRQPAAAAAAPIPPLVCPCARARACACPCACGISTRLDSTRLDLTRTRRRRLVGANAATPVGCIEAGQRVRPIHAVSSHPVTPRMGFPATTHKLASHSPEEQQRPPLPPSGPPPLPSFTVLDFGPGDFSCPALGSRIA